jgi:hypothetical protein
VVALAVACRSRVPDVGPLQPVLREDDQVVELLMEADALAPRDPAAAARNMREAALPRARANWEAAGAITVVHPRANRLRADLVRLTGERASTIEAYATALERNDVSALHETIERQVALDHAMDRLEADFDAAKRAPAERGCR